MQTAGAHVLILSMVGVVGLNLACANIMVITVSLVFHVSLAGTT